MQKIPKYEAAGDELTIFYVDDDHEDQEVFRDAISDIDENLVLYTHDDGDMFLHALGNPPPAPNVIFLDLNMPGKNGFDVLREIRSNKFYDLLPVIVFSTSSDKDTVNKCRDMGANFYITKANDYDELKKSITHVLTIDWGKFRPEPQDFFYKN